MLELLEDSQFYYIVLELMPHGNLLVVLSQIQERKISFTERDAANIVYQVLLALNYMH